MSLHSLMTGPTYGIHVPHQWPFADATARLSATDPITNAAYVSTAVGKYCIQTDTGKEFRLTAVTPTWIPVGENIGEIKMYSGASAPSGYFLCQGQSLLRASYSELFAVIGVVFGSADGTHFTLPDFRGRAPIGVGTGDLLTARTLGESLGQEKAAFILATTSGENNIFQVSDTDDTMQPSLAVNFIIYAGA